ncbi:hypothetical protein R1T08_23620 [Streptomyces sp. SBC-4]|nr:hypothetical protein [Streptomyces sp. SBC-4]MDV5147091.1 hypothetical protein [Streptomyces sp. SBC-4]
MRRRKPGLVAVALCLGGALTACGGGGDDEGYAAVGAGPFPRGAVAPSGAVTLVPLDSPTASGTTSSTSSPAPAPSSSSVSSSSPSSPSPSSDAAGGSAAPSSGPGTSGTSGGSGSSGTESGTAPTTSAPGSPGAGSATPGTAPDAGGGTPPRTPSSAPGTPPAPGTGGPGPSSAPPTTPGRPSPSPTPPPAPALLTVSAPALADADRRWCEQVTVTFRNTGGTAARSGTVTFATHVIGALGVDWATVTSSQALPAPIAAGTARTQTYRVCVDSWRVPLGMRIDTQQVTASWQ